MKKKNAFITLVILTTILSVLLSILVSIYYFNKMEKKKFIDINFVLTPEKDAAVTTETELVDTTEIPIEEAKNTDTTDTEYESMTGTYQEGDQDIENYGAIDSIVDSKYETDIDYEAIEDSKKENSNITAEENGSKPDYDIESGLENETDVNNESSLVDETEDSYESSIDDEMEETYGSDITNETEDNYETDIDM